MILSVQLLVHAVTMYMVTSQTCHGNCTEMLLDPLSFLLIFFCIAQSVISICRKINWHKVKYSLIQTYSVYISENQLPTSW